MSPALMAAQWWHSQSVLRTTVPNTLRPALPRKQNMGRKKALLFYIHFSHILSVFGDSQRGIISYLCT